MINLKQVQYPSLRLIPSARLNLSLGGYEPAIVRVALTIHGKINLLVILIRHMGSCLEFEPFAN